MIPKDPKIEAFFEQVKQETKRSGWSDAGNTLFTTAVGAGLGYWAFGTAAHSTLFGFIVFSIAAVGNRIASDLRQQRARDEALRLVDKHFERKRDGM